MTVTFEVLARRRPPLSHNQNVVPLSCHLSCSRHLLAVDRRPKANLGLNCCTRRSASPAVDLRHPASFTSSRISLNEDCLLPRFLYRRFVWMYPYE